MNLNLSTKKITFNSIPAKLRTLPHWVNWKAEQRGDKTTKIPINPLDLQNAKSNDSSTWTLFDAAVTRINDPGISGIGFMFTGSGITGIDLDHVLKAATGEIEPWAFEIIRRVNSYAEVSPSGTGIHILVESTLPKEGSRKVGQIEVYDSGRFFTVTGQNLNGFKNIREWDGEELYGFLMQVGKDQQIIDKAKSAKNGEKFEILWNGNWSGYYSSQSEADMALVSLLYFYTKDREWTNRLFRKSGLVRAKWDERHYADGTTYGQRILDEICRGETKEPIEDFETWSDPIPLSDYSGLPKFPVDILPSPGREIVKTVAEVNQVDPSLTGSIYLAVLSTCLAKKGEVDLTTHREPINIYTCQILNSGERKTSTMKTLTLPIYEYQKERQDEMIDEVRDAQCKLKIKEAMLAKFQKQASSIDDPIERKKFEVDASNLTKEISENPLPVIPTIAVDDITSEALGDLMADNNEIMALFSAEGGIFGIMAGRYNEHGSNFDIYLKAHAGDPWSSHRVGRNAKSMLSPALSMCLAIQNDVIKEIGENNQFRGRGLLARFLYSLCESQVGQRNRQNKGISESILRQYNEHIKALLDIPLNLHVLNLSPAAQATWDEFYNDIETDMQPSKPLEVIKDWGSKLPGAVARIAGLLHYAKNGIDATNKPISVDIVNASCAIGAYYREHALATFGLMQEDPRIEAAKRILEYINLHQPNTFKGRDVLRYKSALKTMEDVLPGLKVLIERGYIRREIESKAQGIGRPEATSYEVNPKINMLGNHRQ